MADYLLERRFWLPRPRTEVFEFFAERQAPARLTEVARALGYPASSTFVLLKSLRSLGYLDYDRNDRTFLPTLRSALFPI